MMMMTTRTEEGAEPRGEKKGAALFSFRKTTPPLLRDTKRRQQYERNGDFFSLPFSLSL
jgi:hypothetical protein